MYWVIGGITLIAYLNSAILMARWRYSVLRSRKIDDWADKFGLKSGLEHFERWRGDVLFASVLQGVFWPVMLPGVLLLALIKRLVTNDAPMSRAEIAQERKNQEIKIKALEHELFGYWEKD